MNEYEFYLDNFGGVAFDDESEFLHMADKAKRYIKSITYSEPDFENEDVLSCMCALTELYQKLDENLLREKADGYEAEYSAKSEKELLHTAKLYLPAVLLYRGF